MKISLERLFDLLKIPQWTPERIRVGVKFETGHEDCTRYLSPLFVRTMLDEFTRLHKPPIGLDSINLWRGGRRYDPAGWVDKCRHHGFSMETLGTEIFLTEGYTGLDSKTLMNKSGKKIRVLEIGATVTYCQLLVMLTHVTGHPLLGFYGAIADLALGCTARKGKMRIHEDLLPTVNMEKCNLCGLCERMCEWDAIKVAETVVIDPKKCVGCGKCIVKCPRVAIEVTSNQIRDFQIKVADAASFIVQAMDSNIAYFNFLIDCTPHPDFDANSGIPFIPDIGILVSKDPVAIDKATLDLVNRVPGVRGSVAEQFNVLDNNTEKFKAISFAGAADPMIQITSAEELGLGSTKYELIDVWELENE